MSKLFSSTIREDNIIEYNNLREYLHTKHQSIGDFLVESFRGVKGRTVETTKEEHGSALDEQS
jgi:hypothetical protein